MRRQPIKLAGVRSGLVRGSQRRAAGSIGSPGPNKVSGARLPTVRGAFSAFFSRGSIRFILRPFQLSDLRQQRPNRTAEEAQCRRPSSN